MPDIHSTLPLDFKTSLLFQPPFLQQFARLILMKESSGRAFRMEIGEARRRRGRWDRQHIGVARVRGIQR
jgi:hypothetical protein